MLTARGIAAVSQCCQGCLAACRSLGRVGALGRCLAGWERMAVALVFDDLERFLLSWVPEQDSAQATTYVGGDVGTRLVTCVYLVECVT